MAKRAVDQARGEDGCFATLPFSAGILERQNHLNMGFADVLMYVSLIFIDMIHDISMIYDYMI